MTSEAGPLGRLAGMYFDPTKNRYFPIPKDAPPPASSSSSGSSRFSDADPRGLYVSSTRCLDDRSYKRVKQTPTRETKPGCRVRRKTGKMIKNHRFGYEGDDAYVFDCYREYGLMLDMKIISGEVCS